MRADIIKQPKVMVIVTFVAVAAVVFVRMLNAPSAVVVGLDMPLGRLIDGLFEGRSVAGCVVGSLLAFLNGVLMTYLIDKYNVSTVRTYLPLVMYVVMGYGLMAPFGTVGAGVAALLLIVSSEQMIAAFRRSYTFNNIFNSAFCLGILPLLYSPALVLVFVLPVTLSLYRRTAREWIVALAGLGLPLLLASAAWTVAGYEWGFVVESFAEAFLATPDGVLLAPAAGVLSTFAEAGVVGAVSEVSVAAYVYIGLCVSVLLLSAIAVWVDFYKMSVRARKVYVHFICLTLLVGATFFTPSGTIVSAGLIAAPAALVSMAFFIKFRGWLSLAVYLALIVLVVAMNLFPLL